MADTVAEKRARPGSAALKAAASSAVAGVTLVLGWLTYSRDGWVPFLSGVDFGIHELAHLLCMWAPRPVMVFAGSGLQVAVPLALAA